MTKPHGHSIDDYLATIHALVSPVGVYEPAKAPAAIAARVADALGVSRTAVGEMLKRLTAEGLLERGGGRELVLTPAGTARAEQVIRRNRIVERFLTDFLGYDIADAHEHAARVGAAFTEEMVERLHAKLGYPERCPHGWPVAPGQERQESRELVSLAELEKGDVGEIVRQAEHDGGLLSWFEAEGLRPGTQVEVHDVQPAAGHLTVEVGGRPQFIADRAARGLYVRRAPRPQ
jgi:DtxR family Mn-dependent transcriptional regulator